VRLNILLIMNGTYSIVIQLVLIKCFIWVTKSLGLSFHPSDLFTLANLPDHKLGSQQLNCRAVLRELSYAEKLLPECRHCSWCLLLN